MLIEFIGINPLFKKGRILVLKSKLESLNTSVRKVPKAKTDRASPNINPNLYFWLK